MLETLWQDIRFGARMLIKNPGFTLVALVTLALGVGANTTIFSLTNQVLLRQLPVARPTELVVLRSPGPKSGRVWADGDSDASFSYSLFKGLRDQNDVLAGVFACWPLSLNVAGQGQTDRANGELVSGNYFEVLGVSPAMGRMLSPEDETAPGRDPVAVLSYGYWKRKFATDASILNKSLVVNGTSLTVVGVAREGFTGVQVGQLPDVFIPITMKAQMTPNHDGLNDPQDFWLAILGRLKPGWTAARAEAAILPTYRAIMESELPQMKISASIRDRFLDRPLLMDDGAHGRNILQQGVKQPLWILMGMVGLVLLISCANLASLLLARGAARQREMALRLSLGASQLRVIRQLLTESLLLAVVGGCLGIILAWWSVDGLSRAVPQTLGDLNLDAHPDPTVLGFAIGISILTGLLFGLVPAIRATRTSLQETLREQGSAVSESHGNVRLRKGLIIGQIAVTAVLLIGAGLFARSLDNLKNTNLGLRADHLIQFSIAPELNQYKPQQTIDLTNRLRDGVAALPGVRLASAAEFPVLTDTDSQSNVTVEGYTAAENEDTDVGRNFVGPEYFTTMGIPLIAGREIGPGDGLEAPKVAVVNEAFGRRFCDGQNPLGRHLVFGRGNVKPDTEIVGVVKDSKHSDLRTAVKSFVYSPYAQDKQLGQITFYVRTDRDPETMASTLRQTVAQYDPNLPVYDLKTMTEQINDMLFNERLLTGLSICFALLASLLAAVGLYGVMAYTVTRRTREVGIRMALGASRASIVRLILIEVAVMAVSGLALGLISAFFAGKVVESTLFGVKAKDPVAFLIAALLLAGVALLAGYLPARRAAGADPMKSLRYE